MIQKSNLDSEESMRKEIEIMNNDENGITGELIHVKDGNFNKAKGKIVKSLLRAVIIMDRTSKKQLGKSDGYFFRYGRTW
nr:hypothetical protein [uncultured Clostridium sp.]